MSAHIAKSNLSFQLPNLSYIDARWEEPNLRSAQPYAPRQGLKARLLARVAGFRAWLKRQHEMAELQAMSDRELMDVGLNRGDLGRVFDPVYNRDLVTARGCGV